MLEDVRYAARSVTRARGLTAVLVLSLALGTGANAAVCGAVYALLLRAPAGLKDAGALRAVHTSEFSGAPYGRTSMPDYLSLAASPAFASLAAVDDNASANARLGDVELRIRVAAVTPVFFAVLGMQPRAGRLLDATDTGATPRSAVISDDLAGTFGGADTLSGRRVTLGAEEFTIVGVAARGFRGLQAGRVTDAWILLPIDAAADRGDRRLAVIGRPAMPDDELARTLSGLSNVLAEQHPGTNRGTVTNPDDPRRFAAIDYAPLPPGEHSSAAIIAAVVLGAVALLLVSACVNAGTLLLSRAMARRRELAVRMALGASRSRLVRQLLAESLIVSVAGGALGLLFAYWASSAIPALFAPEHAALLDTGIDGFLVLLTLGVAVVAGALFGIAPALQGTGAPAALALRADAGGISEQHGGTRIRGLLISAQLALSTLLLIGTGLLVSSLAQALQGDLDLAAGDVAVLTVQNPGGNCSLFDEVRGSRFQQRVSETLPKMPGVERVGWAVKPPLGRAQTLEYSIQAGAAVRDRIVLDVNVISSTYFRTMGVPVVEGREFGPGDSALAERVAIVDELLARRYFGASAVGHRLLDADGEPLRVIGVVRSGRYRAMQEAAQPTVYLPMTQEHAPCAHLFVRTTGDPAAMLPLIESDLRRADAGVTITRAATLDTLLAEALAIDRLTTTLVAICGLIALLMGAMGVYGVMTDAVLRRTREIGLRVALGAGRPQVTWLVFAEALYLTGSGVVIGVVASLVFRRIAGTVVHGLPGIDWLTLAVTPGILAMVVVLAALVPLRRALAVSPTIALRAE